MALIRSRSLPMVGLNLSEGPCYPIIQARDSGVVMTSEPPSFASDQRSSLLGDHLSGVAAERCSIPDACSNKEGSNHLKDENNKNGEHYSKAVTAGRHYYPEGGWGWVILCVCFTCNVLTHGLHQSYSVMISSTKDYFKDASILSICCLGALSTSVALFLSPITMTICKRKSTRVTAVLGGLVTSLGCLFTSFAVEFHQVFFSYGMLLGIGVGMMRDSSTLMVGQYFKRKREFAEIFVVSSSGFGISLMSTYVKKLIKWIGWRLGLQALTGTIFITFILGVFYRSASLYHPQRRAILHLKNQKRKIKDKSKMEEKPPMFDTMTLKSRTIQILLVSVFLSSFGMTSPIIYLAHQAEQDGLSETSVLLIQMYMGLGWVLGCCIFGFLVMQKNSECRVSRQYLCQASMFLCGVAIFAFTHAVEGYHGYVLFAWIYGIFNGGFHYTLKMLTYEKVRARNFARTWSFVQCSQAIPIAIGVPLTGYINVSFGSKAGYYFSSSLIIFGSFTIFLIDVHRRNSARKKRKSDEAPTEHSRSCPLANCQPEPDCQRHTSLDQLGQDIRNAKLAYIRQRSLLGITEANGEERNKQELTCISEEGIADMDIPDHILEELVCFDDCITSCNKVENFLMMSEYENNLVKTGDLPLLLDRRSRRKLFSMRQNSSAVAKDTCDAVASGINIRSNAEAVPGGHNIRSNTEGQFLPTGLNRTPFSERRHLAFYNKPHGPRNSFSVHNSIQNENIRNSTENDTNFQSRVTRDVSIIDETRK